jgi:hypothetical protein
MTNRELTERLAALEARELKVKDLPIEALRRELAKEPQNPAEILLPHSISTEQIKQEDRFDLAIASASPTTSSTSYQTANQAAKVMDFGGTYIITFGLADMASGSAGGRIALYINGSETSSVFVSSNVGTFSGSYIVKRDLKKGDVVDLRYRAEGGSGNVTFYGMYIFFVKVW